MKTANVVFMTTKSNLVATAKIQNGRAQVIIYIKKGAR